MECLFDLQFAIFRVKIQTEEVLFLINLKREPPSGWNILVGDKLFSEGG